MKTSARPCLLWFLFAMLISFAGLGSFGAAAAEIPRDPAAFTDYVSRAIAKALPTAKVTITAPLSLEVDSAGAGKNSAYLESLYRQCQGIPERCDAIIATWVDQMSTGFARKAQPIDRTRLRIVLRPEGYIEQMRAFQKQDPVAAPFLAGLWMICVSDEPKTIAFPKAADFAALGLSRDEALTLCKQNTSAALQPIMRIAKPAPAGSIGYLEGDAYQSSRLLLPETWKEFAEQSRGELIVSSPGSDVVFYIQSTDARAVDALSALTHDALKKVSRQISPAVFRWTPQGFAVIAP